MRKFRPYEKKTGEELVDMLEKEMTISIDAFKLTGLTAIMGAMYYIMPVGFYILVALLVLIGATVFVQMIVMGTIFKRYERANLIVAELRARDEQPNTFLEMEKTSLEAKRIINKSTKRKKNDNKKRTTKRK